MLRRILSLGVAHKITALVIAALILLAAIITVALTAYVGHSLERMAKERLEQNLSVLYAVLNPRQDSFVLRDGKLMLGDVMMDGDNDVLDAVVGAVGETSTSACSAFSARWPMNTVAPKLSRRSVTAEALRSEPQTR